MKHFKELLISIFMVLVIVGTVWAIERASASIVTGVSSFTDEIFIEAGDKGTITITGVWSGGTLTLQTRLKQGSTYIDVDSATTNGRYEFPGGGDYWRIGAKSGETVTGTAVVTIQG